MSQQISKVVSMQQWLFDHGRSAELPLDVQIELLDKAFAERRKEIEELQTEVGMDKYWADQQPHDISSVREECLPMFVRLQAD